MSVARQRIYRERTRCSSASACLCVCVETCASPCLTPAHNSQSSPRQQRSLPSTKLFIVFVRRARSACPSKVVVRRTPEVSPEKIDDDESASWSDPEPGPAPEEARPEEETDEGAERPAKGGKGNGR